jgi:hypothetical protein
MLISQRLFGVAVIFISMYVPCVNNAVCPSFSEARL